MLSFRSAVYQSDLLEEVKAPVRTAIDDKHALRRAAHRVQRLLQTPVKWRYAFFQIGCLSERYPGGGESSRPYCHRRQTRTQTSGPPCPASPSDAHKMALCFLSRYREVQRWSIERIRTFKDSS